MHGDVTRIESIDNAAECQLECRKNRECSWFVYITEAHTKRPHARKNCYLKGSGFLDNGEVGGNIAGPPSCPGERSVNTLELSALSDLTRILKYCQLIICYSYNFI